MLYASGSGGNGCSYRRKLESLYVDGRGLSLLWVALFVKRHLLPFIQAAQTSTLDGAYVNENVGATTVRLNKPKTLVGLNHFTVPFGICLSNCEGSAVVRVERGKTDVFAQPKWSMI